MTGLFDTSLKLYRMTIKRVRPLHRVTHWLMSNSVIPLLERSRRFHTMPDDPFWFRLELLTDKHETETMQHIREWVKPGAVVLDVGAHVGYYARHFSRLAGSNGRVIAVEPHPRTYKMLARNTYRLQNVTPVQVAVADQEGTAELYDYLVMSASGSLHYDQSLAELQRAHTSRDDVAPRLREDFAVETFTVQTVTIDRLLAEHGLEVVNVVKMDIEGAEMNALRGMRETIDRSPDLTLIMEYNPQALRAFDHVPEDALQEILAMGFTRIRVIEADGRLTDLTNDAAQLTALTERLMAHMDVVNLVITK